LDDVIYNFSNFLGLRAINLDEVILLFKENENFTVVCSKEFAILKQLKYN